MNARTLFLTTLTVLMSISLAPASVTVDLVDSSGNDSGWSMILADDVHNGVVIDGVNAAAVFVTIEIAKDYYLPMANGVFPPNVIGFRQRLDDSLTVGTIRITDEVITNHTGREWTDYHWEILDSTAAFDRTATEASGFSTGPFTTDTWGPAPSGWTAQHSASLSVAGGVVPNGGVYLPGMASGWLEIDVDLAQDDSDFDLTQYPTPEPGTLVLLALGGAAVLGRRMRR